MTEKYIILACQMILILVITAACWTVVAASWYDLRAVTRRKRQMRALPSLRGKQQPYVSILVYAHNNASTILRCLDSIRRSYYRQYCVTVINNQSADATKAIVMAYKSRYPNMPLRLYTPRIAVNRAAMLVRAYKMEAAHPLVYCLDATVSIRPSTVKHLVAYATVDEQPAILRTYQAYQYAQSIATVLPRIIQLSRQMIAKVLPTAANGPRLLRSTALLHPQKRHTKRYMSDEIVQANEQPLRWVAVLSIWRIVIYIGVACSVAVMITYFFSTAIALRSSSLLIYSWATVGLWASVVVWSNDDASVRQKIDLTAVLPALYMLLYIASFGFIAYQLYRIWRTYVRQPLQQRLPSVRRLYTSVIRQLQTA